MTTRSIRISARLRPFLPNEQDDGGISAICPSSGPSHVPTGKENESHNSESSLDGGAKGKGKDKAKGEDEPHIAVVNPRDAREVWRFPFTSVHMPTSSTSDLFEQDVKPMLDSLFEGITLTVFAYGVTSSGKTHTMQGTKEDPGVVPRCIEYIFSESPQPSARSIEMSYMELYKEEVYDLLVEREKAAKLAIRTLASGEISVPELNLQPISSVKEFEGIYERATKQRSTGSTNLNHASSRSHSILTIRVQTRTSKTISTGKIHLVDLAGAENNKATGNTAERLVESSAINKSLSTLGMVVHAINRGDTRIPYRNSKLTRLLQSALGGDSLALLILNLAPGAKMRNDVLGCLNFATRTKNISNRVITNTQDLPVTARHSLAPSVPGGRHSIAGTVGARTSLGGTFGPRASFSGMGVNPFAPGPSSFGFNGGERKAGRGSLIPQPRGFNFTFGTGAGSNTSDGDGAGGSASGSSAAGAGLSEKEIDERIAKAVEAEVKRRLEALEAERDKLGPAGPSQPDDVKVDEESDGEVDCGRDNEQGMEVDILPIVTTTVAPIENIPEEEDSPPPYASKPVPALKASISPPSIGISPAQVPLAPALPILEAPPPSHVSSAPNAVSNLVDDIRPEEVRVEKQTYVIPQGVLTPLVRKHLADSGALGQGGMGDDALRARVEEVERRLADTQRTPANKSRSSGNSADAEGGGDAAFALLLSPVAKKKMGKMYVSLARCHCEKGDLKTSLALYQKAQNYVPDNARLRDRIIEIEYAVKWDKPYIPSPKQVKDKSKGEKHRKREKHGSKKRRHENNGEDDGAEVDDDEIGREGGKRKRGTRTDAEDDGERRKRRRGDAEEVVVVGEV